MRLITFSNHWHLSGSLVQIINTIKYWLWMSFPPAICAKEIQLSCISLQETLWLHCPWLWILRVCVVIWCCEKCIDTKLESAPLTPAWIWFRVHLNWWKVLMDMMHMSIPNTLPPCPCFSKHCRSLYSSTCFILTIIKACLWGFYKTFSDVTREQTEK